MFAPKHDRRAFLRGAVTGGAALSLGLRPLSALAQDAVTGQPKAGKIGDFKVSLAEWSLHKRLFADRSKSAEMNLDFPRMAREEFGIEAVEFVNQFFKDKARDSAYLGELKRRSTHEGVTPLLIMIDGEGSLSDKDEAKRKEAVENHKKWVDAAAALGCHSIRVNTGDNYSPTNLGAATEGCGALAEYGKAHNVHIICENHGGPSSDPDSLIALIKSVNSPFFGTLPDFGNFPKNADGSYSIDIYEAIARLMPYAKGVSAKSYDFDDKGNETKLDYARILKIVTDAGYHGYIGIEYEGGRLGEPEGIAATKKLMDRLRGSEYTG